jgi:hypothetical protein
MTPSPVSDRQQFRETLAALATKTHTKIPALNGRVEKATRLVLAGDVVLHADGTALVSNLSDPLRVYQVAQGVCECRDYAQAPEHLCCHRLAAGFLKKVQELLPPPAQAPGGVPAEHIVLIQGKPFVRFAGLLQMALERGLVSLTAEWTCNDAELSLAHAVALFQDGRRFEESGDASPSNVTKKVAPHFRRVALTRAKARVLRDALGVDLVAVEELEED